jgi:hypothetical protein
MGRFEESKERLLNALAIEERMGAKPFMARTLGMLAQLERATGIDGGVGRSAEFLRKALDLCDLLGCSGIPSEIQAWDF